MADNKSLYDDLGVEPDASAAEITRAFRKKTRDTHPDRCGGDEAQFKAVAFAYRILSDHARRQHYDATGDSDNAPSGGEILEVLGAVFNNVLGQVLESEADSARVDMVAMMHQFMANSRETIRKETLRLAKMKNKLAKIPGRFTVDDGGENFLQVVAKRRLDECEAALVQTERELAKCEEAISYLKRFSYRFESGPEGYNGLMTGMPLWATPPKRK